MNYKEIEMDKLEIFLMNLSDWFLVKNQNWNEFWLLHIHSFNFIIVLSGIVFVIGVTVRLAHDWGCNDKWHRAHDFKLTNDYGWGLEYKCRKCGAIKKKQIYSDF